MNNTSIEVEAEFIAEEPSLEAPATQAREMAKLELTGQKANIKTVIPIVKKIDFNLRPNF